MTALTPWDIPAPNADDPGAKIVSLHRGAVPRIDARRTARAFNDRELLDAIEARLNPPAEFLQLVREEDQRLNSEPRPSEAWLLLAGIVGALLWLGIFKLASWAGWLA